MSRSLLLQLLHQQRPLQPHPYNTPFRAFDFDGQRIVLGLDIVDLALEVLAFRAVPRVFSPRIRRMMSPRFLLSASRTVEPRRGNDSQQQDEGYRERYREVWMRWRWGGHVERVCLNQGGGEEVNPWPGGTRISFD
jgi:hypothetical protein